eukprot:14202-Eustigmatos_ZCMA.PRE.1
MYWYIACVGMHGLVSQSPSSHGMGGGAADHDDVDTVASDDLDLPEVARRGGVGVNREEKHMRSVNGMGSLETG